MEYSYKVLKIFMEYSYKVIIIILVAAKLIIFPQE